MLRLVHILVIILITTLGCQNSGLRSEKRENRITTNQGEINISSDGQFTLKIDGKITRFNDVVSFIWFNGAPYFELKNGKIMKWNQEVSDNSFNLEKVWDNLYFIKQYGEGAALDATSLNKIDRKGNIHEIMLKKGNVPHVTENYGIFYGWYIFDESREGYCIAGEDGKIVECHPWPK